MDHCYPTDIVKVATKNKHKETPAKLCISMSRENPSKYDKKGVSYITKWFTQLLTSQFEHDCPSRYGKGDSDDQSCGACRDINRTIIDKGAGIFIPVTCLDHHKAHFKYLYRSPERDELDLRIDKTQPSRILCYYNRGGIQYQLFPFSGESVCIFLRAKPLGMVRACTMYSV